VRVFFGWLRLPFFLGLGSRASSGSAPEMKVTRPSKVLRCRWNGRGERADSTVRGESTSSSKIWQIWSGPKRHPPLRTARKRQNILAEATAGEFGLNYYYISPTQLLSMWVGNTQANIRQTFESGASRRPVLIFIDEIDSLGSTRQTLSRESDPGGAGRSYNNSVLQLMQSINEHWGIPALSSWQPQIRWKVLIRDGRFDAQIRVDMPDEPTRKRIFEAQLLRNFTRPLPSA